MHMLNIQLGRVKQIHTHYRIVRVIINHAIEVYEHYKMFGNIDFQNFIITPALYEKISPAAQCEVANSFKNRISRSDFRKCYTFEPRLGTCDEGNRDASLPKEMILPCFTDS